MMMVPNSKAANINDVQILSDTAPAGFVGLTSRSLVSTTAGPLCYVYD